jgi:hypothetical protein
MKDFKTPASQETINKVIEALKANGFDAEFAADGIAALGKLRTYVPEGSEVFTMSSITLQTIGAAQEFNDASKYVSVRDKFYSMDQATQGREMSKLGAAPDFAMGSVHALTEGGTLIIASLTGSQLPAYAYGAGKVIFVIGAQKIVASVEEGMQRINDYVIGLESERARKAYGLPEGFRTAANKMLTFNRELIPERVRVIIVGEALGF